MQLGSTHPRWVLVAGATLAVLLLAGTGRAVPLLWQAGHAGPAVLLAVCSLAALRGLARHWPGARERRVWREAVAEAHRLVRALARREALEPDDAGRLPWRTARERLLGALEGDAPGRLSAEVKAAQALLPGHGWRVVVLWATGAVVVALLLRVFVVGTFQVVSVSMAPTLVVGDLLVVDRLAYLTASPARGDVIVWEAEGASAGRDYVKRVVGVAGDQIEQRGRGLWVNGQPLPLSLVGEVELGRDGRPTSRTRFLLDGELWQQTLGQVEHRVITRKSVGARTDGRWTVAAGQVFVVGDNRDDSLDSRSEEVGQVPVEQVVGRVRWVLASRSASGWQSERFFQPVR